MKKIRSEKREAMNDKIYKNASMHDNYMYIMTISIPKTDPSNIVLAVCSCKQKTACVSLMLIKLSQGTIPRCHIYRTGFVT